MQKKLWELLQDLKKGRESDTAFLYRDGSKINRVSYQEFVEDVLGYAYGCSLLREDRVGIWGYNSYFWIVTALGLLLSGKTAVFLDANLSDEDFLELTAYTEINALAVSEELEEDAERLYPHMPRYSFLELKGEALIREADIREKAFICFTSGTSRSSKGVVIATGAAAEATRRFFRTLPGKAGERFYLPLPFHHIYGFTEILNILVMGGTLCLGEVRYAEADLEEFQPQVAFLVPTMLKFLLDRNRLPKSLYAIVSGGSACRKEYAEAVRASGRIFHNMYGLSETLGAVCCSAEGKSEQWYKPFDGIRFIISDGGELGMELPWHMEEYYRRPEDTRKVLKGDIFWTGDAAELDKDGFVCIKGRIRDTIVLENGEKVHAEDMDREWTDMEEIEEAAVFQNDRELLVAVRAAEGFQNGREKELLERFNSARPVSHRIRKVWLCPCPLPRTSTGKLKRFELERLYREWRKKHA